MLVQNPNLTCSQRVANKLMIHCNPLLHLQERFCVNNCDWSHLQPQADVFIVCPQTEIAGDVWS